MEITVTFPTAPPPDPARKLYRVFTDREIYENKVIVPGHGQFYHSSGPDWRADLPAVFWLFGGTKVTFDEVQQRLAWDMMKDYVESNKKFAKVYRYDKAFNNKTGFENPDDPRHNYITGEHASYPDPEWDKVRVCSNAVISGRETYSVIQTFKDAYSLLVRTITAPKSLIGNVKQSAVSLVTNNMLIVDTIHPDNIPTWAELQKTPWLYFKAVSSTSTGDTTPFPQSIDGQPIYIPLIAKTEVRFPLSALVRIGG